MNIPQISKVQDPVAKALILEIMQRLEKVEQKQQPTQAIGYLVKEGEKQMQTAFRKVHHTPD